ncbi:MAG: PilZ domain-containing protein [Pseudomonadota bacterium]
MGQTVDTQTYETLARNQIERRSTTRMLVEIQVTLATDKDLHVCHMTNISDEGAMLETPSPPVSGTRARLVMGDDVVQCEVVWRRQQMCGVKFHQTLGTTMLGSITRETGNAQAKAGERTEEVKRDHRWSRPRSFGRKLPPLAPRRN